MQRVGGQPVAARRGAEQRHFFNPFGMAQSQFLRHHAAKRQTNNRQAVIAQRIHQRGGIICIGLHRVAAIRLVGLTKPALVIAGQMKMARQRAVHDIGRYPQIAARAVNR